MLVELGYRRTPMWMLETDPTTWVALIILKNVNSRVVKIFFKAILFIVLTYLC